MYSISDINKVIDAANLDRAIEMLDHNIETQPLNATWWFMRGRVYWRMDCRGNAISDYEEAVHLDPNSPAAMALEMARGIMDFYNPDLLNP